MNSFDTLIYFCAVILPWVMGGGLIVYFFLTKKKVATLRLLTASFSSALIAWFLVSLYKYNFPHPRPFEVLENIKPLFITGRGDAFPSGHATFLGALAMGAFLQNKKIGLILFLGAIIVSLARVLAYVHWPIDVIVGLLAGGLIGGLISLVFGRLIFKRFRL